MGQPGQVRFEVKTVPYLQLQRQSTVKGSFDQLEDISVSEWTARYAMMLRRSWKVCTNRFLTANL